MYPQPRKLVRPFVLLPIVGLLCASFHVDGGRDGERKISDHVDIPTSLDVAPYARAPAARPEGKITP